MKGTKVRRHRSVPTLLPLTTSYFSDLLISITNGQWQRQGLEWELRMRQAPHFSISIIYASSRLEGTVPYSRHNMASGTPSLPLRYNCVGISHLWILETVSGFDIVNDASNGSNNRVWLSFSFLISSSNALLVSIPVSYYCY